MSGQDQTPIAARKCSNCGHDNAAGRLFCQRCGYRIVARPQDAPVKKEPPTPSPEPQPPPVSLQDAQAENQSLQQQLASIHEELNRLKLANSRPELSPAVVAELHTKLKSAEGKVAESES